MQATHARTRPISMPTTFNLVPTICNLTNAKAYMPNQRKLTTNPIANFQTNETQIRADGRS